MSYKLHFYFQCKYSKGDWSCIPNSGVYSPLDDNWLLKRD